MDRKPHTFKSLSNAVTKSINNLPKKLQAHKALTLKCSNPSFNKLSVNTIHSTPRTNSSIKSFFEMLGVQAESPKNLGKIPNLKVSTHKISLTDFMGKKKHVFFKNTGFLTPYEEYKRNLGINKILEKKQVVSHSNILHKDLIREYSIRSPIPQKTQSIDSVFIKPKYQKTSNKLQLKGDIEKIIKGCEKLYKESKKTRNELELQLKCSESNSPLQKKKMSLQDIQSIRKIMEII